LFAEPDVSLGYLALALGLSAALSTIGSVHAVLGGYVSALVGLVGFGLAIRLTAPAEYGRFGTLLLWTAALSRSHARCERLTARCALICRWVRTSCGIVSTRQSCSLSATQ
jgi:hypothetical protein